MKERCLTTCLSIVLGAGSALGTDFADVHAKPDKYEGRHVELVGIARVPGYFYLFAEAGAAANTDLSKAVPVRRNNFTQPEYRELDRQWVRVTGVMNSQPRRGWDPVAGVLLEHVELLRDRPPPRIPDRTVLGVFRNNTAQPLAIELISRSAEGGTIFFLKPGDVDEIEIWEGRAVVSALKGPKNLSLDKREIGKSIATGEITFSDLSADYQYSSESSDKRRLYFRIFGNRIERVSASGGKDWKTHGDARDGR
jgi:hypothetical protein